MTDKGYSIKIDEGSDKINSYLTGACKNLSTDMLTERTKEMLFEVYEKDFVSLNYSSHLRHEHRRRTMLGWGDASEELPYASEENESVRSNASGKLHKARWF